jgi:hypothetical protein
MKPQTPVESWKYQAFHWVLEKSLHNQAPYASFLCAAALDWCAALVLQNANPMPPVWLILK